PGTATRTFPPPLTTWALVSTCPSGVRIMPVPAAVPLKTPRPMESVIDTTAGSTFATMPRTLVGVVDEAEPDCVVAATGTGTGALRGDHTDSTTAATTRPATSPETAPAIAPGTIPRRLGAGSGAVSAGAPGSVGSVGSMISGSMWSVGPVNMDRA